MASLFGARPMSQTVTRYASVGVQTSSLGLCIPIVWGRTRLAAANLIWKNGFESVPGNGGGKGGKGGGGGKSGATSYTYSTALILALCEGPITGIGTVWASQNTTTLGALNFTLFPGTADQAPPAWITSNYPAEARPYAETAHLFSSRYSLGNSTAIPNHNCEVIGKYSGTYDWTPDANFADIIPDFVTSEQYGIDPGATYIDAPSVAAYRIYTLAQGLLFSPALTTAEQGTSIIQRWAQISNTWIFWSGVGLVFCALGTSAITAHGVTYTPSIAPLYDLTTDDFIFDAASGEKPITIGRVDPADGYNNVQIDTLDRGNGYNNNPLRFDDQTSEDQLGVLQSLVVQANEICDPNVGQIAAFLIGKRSVYVRNNPYKFRLRYNYFLLLPGDIVTLTDANIGLSRLPVRISKIGRDDKMVLNVEAEECPASIGSATLYPPQGNAAAPMVDILADPGAINVPAIFEPSPVLTNGRPEIWIAGSGGANWGGAQVYVSADNVNFAWIGSITAPSAQGVLSAALASHADPDTANTLLVDLSASGMRLSTAVTPADADAMRTVSIVGAEIVSFGTAAATGAETFGLSYLRRGLYGTAPAAHAIGERFTRVDPASVFQHALTADYVGVPLYFKFPSFNRFGEAAESIADAEVYEYTPTGVGFFIAAPTAVGLAASRVTQADGTTILTMTATWTASTGPTLGGYGVQFSSDGGATWTVDCTTGASSLQYALTLALAGMSYQARVRALSQSGLAVSAWAVSAVVASGALLTSVPAEPAGLTVSAVTGGATLSWTASSDATILSYQVWVATGTGTAFGSAALFGTYTAPASTLTISGPTPAADTIFLVAVNAAGSSAPAG